MSRLDNFVDVPPPAADRVPVSPGRGLRLALALQTDPLPLLTSLNAAHGPVVRLRLPRRPVDFAITEDTLVLTGILRRWRLRPAPDAPPVRPRAQVTLHPRDGVWLTTTRVGAA